MQTFAIAALLVGAAVAAPSHGHQHMHKRDLAVVTHVDEVIETEVVTKTVWVDAGAEATPSTPVYTPPAPSVVATTLASVYIPPAAPAHTTSSSSSSSVYVAPSSTYVAPPSSTYVAPTSTYVAPPSSTYVAPTSTYVAPPSSTYVAPTSTYVAPSSTTVVAAAAAASSDSSSLVGDALSQVFSGDLTWYETGMGSCGIDSGSSDAIVAISHSVFDEPSLAGFTDLVATANPNANPMCGKKVRIYGATGTYTATVVDRCTGCLASDLDLSHGFFQTVTGESDGRISNTKWEYIS